MMVANDLMELSLRDGDVEVSLRRPNSHAPECAPVNRVAAPQAPAALPSPESEAGEDDVEIIDIESPMVGTFYTAADPESSPFVQVGTHVQPSTVVCIVEAMKVFNEIKAGVTGIIERILVKNANAVEFGQPMFQVRPA